MSPPPVPTQLTSVACGKTGQCVAIGTYALVRSGNAWKAYAFYPLTLATATACLPTRDCTVVGTDAMGIDGLFASSGTF